MNKIANEGQKSASNLGFTLVEISIVLVIIGLLVSGVLVGQSLIKAAKITRLVSDLQQYEIAIKRFENTFKNYPGDSPYFVPAAAPDGRIWQGDTNGNGQPNNVNCNGIYHNYEHYNFWNDLSVSKMISYNYPKYLPTECDASGVHEYADARLGMLTPYTDLDDSRAIDKLNGEKYWIRPEKFSDANNLMLYLYTDPIDALSLESKLGGDDWDASYKQKGLVNIRGLTNCAAVTSGVVPCIDENAAYGFLGYFIAE